ncbi:CRISPR-associated protein Cas4 [bacterium]|nr:MAG: CRISPR-associated protein Cas4 [bacterium]
MLDNDSFTGTQINYLVVCPRKLWLFSHGIEMEREDQNVQMGKQIGQGTYEREKKEINLDNQVVIDWADAKPGPDGVLTIHEVKKSRAVSRAHRLQMLYYLHFLRQKGVAARGVIDYPELKQRETIELDAPAQRELDQVLQQVSLVVNSEQSPPRLDKRSFCSKCAYFDLCYV